MPPHSSTGSNRTITIIAKQTKSNRVREIAPRHVIQFFLFVFFPSEMDFLPSAIFFSPDEIIPLALVRFVRKPCHAFMAATVRTSSNRIKPSMSEGGAVISVYSMFGVDLGDSSLDGTISCLNEQHNAASLSTVGHHPSPRAIIGTPTNRARDEPTACRRFAHTGPAGNTACEQETKSSWRSAVSASALNQCHLRALLGASVSRRLHLWYNPPNVFARAER